MNLDDQEKYLLWLETGTPYSRHFSFICPKMILIIDFYLKTP